MTLEMNIEIYHDTGMEHELFIVLLSNVSANELG